MSAACTPFMSAHRPRQLGRMRLPLHDISRHYLLLAATTSALLFTLTACWKALRNASCTQGRCTKLASVSSSSWHGRRSGLFREAHVGARPSTEPPALMSKVPPDMRCRYSKAAVAIGTSGTQPWTQTALLHSWACLAGGSPLPGAWCSAP